VGTHFTPFTHTAMLNMQPRERENYNTFLRGEQRLLLRLGAGGSSLCGGFYHPRRDGPNDQDIHHYDSNLNPNNKTITGLKTLTLVTGKTSGVLFVQGTFVISWAVPKFSGNLSVVCSKQLIGSWRFDIYIYISEPCQRK
jgi:hypothetical protein